MIDFLRDLLYSVILSLNGLPLPWRPVLLLLFIAFSISIIWYPIRIVLNSLSNACSVILKYIALLWLYPEYQVTTTYRLQQKNPPSWLVLWSSIAVLHVLAYDNLLTKIQPIVMSWRLQKRWVALICLIIIGAWYVEPQLRSTPLAGYISNSFRWYSTMEGRVIDRLAPEITLPSRSNMPGVLRVAASATPRPTAVPTRTAVVVPTSTLEIIPLFEINSYIVQSGDSLHKIADRFNVSVDALVAANQINYPSLIENPTRISVGWQLTIPPSE